MSKEYFFSQKSGEEKKYNFMRSIDDKAYLRPGTSEGFSSVRNGRILTPSAESKMKNYQSMIGQLVVFIKHPQPIGYCIVKVNLLTNEEKVVSTGDSHYVFVRPKAYIDSSGTTWASETVTLRHLMPVDFEVEESSTYSIKMRSLRALLHDQLFQFLDMTEDGDVCKIISTLGKERNSHMEYELERLDHLIYGLERFCDELDGACMLKPEEKNVLISMNVRKVISNAVNLQKLISSGTTHENLLDELHEFTDHLTKVCNILEDLELPKMKPRWVDITDGGPGVAVSNFDVRFRDCEMARMWKSDYRLRIHLSWNDSHSNEAESSNSAIADSVVDGGTIDWEKVKLFDNLSDAEISAMSINDFDAHQRQHMRVNACSVQKEIVKRIDGAPCLNEYIKAFETPDHPFFFNKKLLYKHHNSSESGNPNIPVQNYFRKVMTFMKSHYRFGELHMEFKKEFCINIEHESCQSCKNGWIGPKFDGIPEPMPDYSKLPAYHYHYQL